MTKQESHREACRRWRKTHPDESKEAQRKHYAKHREEIRERRRKHRLNNQEYMRARARNWRQRHLELERERVRKWKTNNPESRRSWAKITNAKRRAAKHGIAIELRLRPSEWEAIKLAYKNRCAYCGRKPKRLTQDHIVPLIKGGHHTRENVVPSCLNCNSKKQAKSLKEMGWAIQKDLF